MQKRLLSGKAVLVAALLAAMTPAVVHAQMNPYPRTYFPPILDIGWGSGFFQFQRNQSAGQPLTAVAPYFYYQGMQGAGNNDIARSNDKIDARFEKAGKLLLSWQGQPNMVARIRFAILDKQRRVIREEVISRLPAEARFTMTNKTDFYRVVVEYLNGTTNTVTSPI